MIEFLIQCKKSISIPLLFCISYIGYSQKDFVVQYQHYMDVSAEKPFQKHGQKILLGGLIVKGDSITYYRLAHKPKDLTDTLDIFSQKSNHATIKNLNQPYYFSVSSLLNFHYLIKEEDSVKWAITDEKMLILKIPCTKAISENKIAWFAPSIPIKSGPMNFFGLPGLILCAYDSKYNMLYEATKILNISPPITSSGDIQIVTFEEFKSLYMKNNSK